MVKRYLIGVYGEHEHPNGDFVHWQDYHALRAELKQVKRELEAQTLRAERAELQLSVHVAERLAGARVKALEWNEDWSGELDDIPVWHAMTPWGRVSVSFAGRGYKQHSDVPAYELQEKLAAAQADYERRILSALAEPAGEVEPHQFLPTEDGEFNGNTFSNDPVPFGWITQSAYDRVNNTSLPEKVTIIRNAVGPTDMPRVALYTTPPDAGAIRDALPVATEPFVRRLIRIFNDRPTDDTSAIVLIDYAKACANNITAEPAAPTSESPSSWYEAALSDLLARIHRDGGHYESEHGVEKAVRDADEPAAPEGQQPVAWQRRQQYSDIPGYIPQWQFVSKEEATGHFERRPGYEYRPLYTRPSEQAVTEAMVEAATASLRPDLFTPLDPTDLRSDDFAWTRREEAKANALHKARAALKAAMEAGR